MTLINELKAVCDRLAPLGWRDLLKKVTHNSLDIEQATEAKLKAALLKTPISDIDRTRPGFEDFDGAGRQGITQGKPYSKSALSRARQPLRYARRGRAPLKGFPTPRELETVENAVFGLQPPTLASLVQAAGGKLSVVVFALEYRPAVDVPDRAHADLVFSRTGISRVGTARPKYLPDVRGFWPKRTRIIRTASASSPLVSRRGSPLRPPEAGPGHGQAGGRRDTQVLGARPQAL